MADAYVIRNQLGQYLTRKGEWVSGRDASILFHQTWFDQALNQLIEVNAKDIELRGKVEELALDDKGRPIVVELGPDPQQPELLDQTTTVQSAAEAGAPDQPVNADRVITDAGNDQTGACEAELTATSPSEHAAA